MSRRILYACASPNPPPSIMLVYVVVSAVPVALTGANGTASLNSTPFFVGRLQARRWQQQCARLEPHFLDYAATHTAARLKMQRKSSGCGGPRILLAPFTGDLNCCLGNIIGKLLAVLALGMASGRAVFFMGGQDDEVMKIMLGRGFNWSLPEACRGRFARNSIEAPRSKGLDGAFAVNRTFVLRHPTYALWQELLGHATYRAYFEQYIKPHLANRWSDTQRTTPSYTTPVRQDYAGCLQHFMLAPGLRLRREYRAMIPPGEYSAVHVRLARLLIFMGVPGLDADRLAIVQPSASKEALSLADIDTWMANHSKNAHVTYQHENAHGCRPSAPVPRALPMQAAFSCIGCHASSKPVFLASDSAMAHRAVAHWAMEQLGTKLVQRPSNSTYVPNDPRTRRTAEDLFDVALDYLMMSGASELFLQLSMYSSLSSAALERSLPGDTQPPCTCGGFYCLRGS